VSVLIDTNLLVYRFDPIDPTKQRLATELLAQRLQAGEPTFLPHQAIIEFVAAVTRPRRALAGEPLLIRREALIEAEAMMQQFDVLYPDALVLQTALRGAEVYDLSWFDAHLWAYAEVNSIPEILSEDFHHGCYYGSVRVMDPFAQAAGGVRELPALYG